MVEEFKWVALSLLTVWVVALCVPSVRDSYANGWRCLLRHASLWKLPGGFALAYGLFQLLDFLLLHWRIGRVPEVAPLLARMPLDYRQIGLESILPAAELLAAALNCLVATFPISIFCGLLFLANYRGLTGELGYALLRRYRIWGWVWLGLLAACALASLLKPLTILALPELARILSVYELLVVSSVVNGLSFAFEYLLGYLRASLLASDCLWLGPRPSFSPRSCAAIRRASHGFRAEVGTGDRPGDPRAYPFTALRRGVVDWRSDWLEDFGLSRDDLSPGAGRHHGCPGHGADPSGPSQRLSTQRARRAWTLPKKAWPKLSCFLDGRILPPFLTADSATGRKRLARCSHLQAGLVDNPGNCGSHQRRLDSRILGLLL